MTNRVDKTKNAILRAVVLAILAILSNTDVSIAEIITASDTAIEGSWGESENQGETFWSIYQFRKDGDVKIKIYPPGYLSVVSLQGAYQYDSGNMCITIEESSHPEWVPIESNYCLSILEIQKQQLVLRQNNQKSIMYRVSDNTTLIDRISQAKKRSIYQLLVHSGKMDAIQNVLTSKSTDMVRLLRNFNKNISDRVSEKIGSEIVVVLGKELSPGGSLFEAMAILYNKYFTVDEVDDIAAFYQSDAGRKYGELTQLLAEETSMSARTWESHLRPVLEDIVHSVMQREGYVLKNQ